MTPDWFLIFVSRSLPEANIIKGMLEENNVPVVLMNKQDSSYLNFGDVELYVPQLLKELARQLVDKALLN